MDTLYIGDIPSDYHYATFGNDYITLYNVPSAHNQTIHYYRVYDYDFGFYYTEGDQTVGQNYNYYQNINVSDNWLYRSDIDKIFLVLFCIFVMFLFIFNIITSCVKKGGVFGGLF